MNNKLADQIMNDDSFDSFDDKIDMLIDLARELEGIATDALKMFKCTQNLHDYQDSHWSNRLEVLLTKRNV